MVALKGERVGRFLKQPNLNIALLHGNDGALINARANALAKGFGPEAETIRLDAAALKDNPGRVIDEARAISMFGGLRVIRVTLSGPLPGLDDLLTNPPTDVMIIIERASSLKASDKMRKAIEASANGAVIGCYTGDAGSIEGVLDDALRKAGLTIHPDAKARVIAMTMGLGVGAQGEIDKLCLYTGDDTEVTLEHVEAVLDDGASSQIGQVSDLIGEGRQEEADRMVQRLLAEGIDAGVIALVTLRHFTTLHRLAAAREDGTPLAVAAKSLRPPLFASRLRDVERQLGRWSKRGLEIALDELAAALRDSRVRYKAGPALVTNVLTRLPRLMG